MASAPIDRRRDRFQIPKDCIYLLSHSLGPPPTMTDDCMAEYVKRWRHHGSEDAWAAEWWDLSCDVGDRVARLIGAEPGTVAIQPSATVAMAAAASCFEFSSRRNRIVTTALDFPSMGYFLHAQRRVGATPVVVPSDDGICMTTDRIVEAIDDRTALVALSHVSYRSSAKIETQAIVQAAHEHGAMVVLDAYQSVGIMEVEAARWGVDFLVGGSIKWLCGGPSCGYLYVRPDLIGRLEPKLTGWIGHAAPFDFVHGATTYDDSIRRFAQGTPNIPGMYSFLAGLRAMEGIDLSAVAAESRRRTQWMIDFALARGWHVRSPLAADRRGGSVMIDFADSPALTAGLARRGVVVDCRPSVGLRISPHFFNTDEEVRQAMGILDELVSK